MPRQRSSGKLTLHQQARIAGARQERTARRRGAVVVEEEGNWGAEEDGLVVAHYGYNVAVKGADGVECRAAVRETLSEDPVCGDKVRWRRNERGEGIIEALEPRHGVLVRPTFRGARQVLAANVDQMVITVAAYHPNTGLIDRYLVAAEVAGIVPIIVVNKMDLVEAEEDLNFFLAPYPEMGYLVIKVSAVAGKGLKSLGKCLQDRVSVVVGHSGVGKSSLIARWVPDETLSVRTVNRTTGKGRHTTAVARLYPLEGGGALIDSPGIRAFGLSGVAAADIPRYFRDIAPYLDQCRFSDCRHREEPGCQVKKAVKKGKIDALRLESLHRMVDSLDEV
ncbi:MAG: ribosome small subunit-dependent GTPase A [Magnetococcales bacterium]|nr:ribosome small subunit-dependent GTPase A [Magnetococcales bacterium]MBF0154617.1 ribosome small subunit-dependent GTPase A [Magnetococcales bacterium]MBF0308743.1 ribosome small subunit-dependent GTPase A [Magnetococcales bacterium]